MQNIRDTVPMDNDILLKEGDVVFHKGREGTIMFPNDDDTYAVRFGGGAPAKYKIKKEELRKKIPARRFGEAELFRAEDKKIPGLTNL